MRGIVGLTVMWLALGAAPARAAGCGDQGVWVQVLGSGGPEVQTKRASSSYLVWVDGKARVLVDAGGGSALRFGESGAAFADLDVILFTHLHADHTADLPALVNSSWFDSRKRPLPLFGPDGNRVMPSTVTFIRTLFDPTRGAYRYLSDVLSPQDSDGYKLRPRDVSTRTRKPVAVFANERVQATPAPVGHGTIPALAWGVIAGGKEIVFTGDTNGEDAALAKLAQGADLLIAHNAVPEGASGAERALHMPPGAIGRLAKDAGVQHLVLSHRMQRTLGREVEITQAIRAHFGGPMDFAEDLACYQP